LIKKVTKIIIDILRTGSCIVFILSLIEGLKIVSPTIRNITFQLTIAGIIILILRLFSIKIIEEKKQNRDNIFIDYLRIRNINIKLEGNMGNADRYIRSRSL
jgi:hypothetical protein